ncbi:hypothetical protein [Nonomuraea sp. NPDC050786]|uniref:hypothetical protein n=1 Tax=Nonomuraea sp. NPDC050786 TaxID=3154840 RepID=UPI0033D3687D
MTTTSNEAQALIARMDNLREDQDVAFATLCDARDHIRDINIWTRRCDRNMTKLDGKVARVEQKTDKALGLAVQAGEKLDALDGRVAVLETDVKELKTDVAVLKTDVSELKVDVSELKTVVKSDLIDVKALLGEVLERLPAKA